MGFMTTVTFLNDIWHVIKKNPQEFMDVIEQGMSGINPLSLYGERKIKTINDYGIKNCGNGIDVGMSHHADVPALYLVYRNCMTTFGRENDNLDLELKKKILKIARAELKLESDRIKELEK